ncbi:MAG: ABC transporter permease subunit [Clostridia bacterium]|nr:ABC transporter permease subunit [Clostridia bacterium]
MKKATTRPPALNLFFLVSLTVFLLLLIAFMAVPSVSLIVSSLTAEGGEGFSLEHYAKVFTSALYQVSFQNSLLLSLRASVAGIIIALAASYALTRWGGESFQRKLLVLVNMTSNFAGVPLAFAFIVMLGNAGVFVILCDKLGLSLLDDFSIYSSQGLFLVYTYFQVPLGVMLLYPIYRGIREDWKEAARILGASVPQFWLRVGVPAILPSVLSTFTILFANAMGAYATAYQLVSSSYNLVPLRISALITGDIRTKPELGSALAVVLALALILIMMINEWAARLASRKGLKS